MIMLYALSIESEYDGQRIERITIKIKNINEIYRVANPSYPFVLYAEIDKRTSYRIELKPNKNFNTVSGFFDYIKEYSEIAFETKEIPTKREIKIGDIYCARKDLYYVVFGIRDDIENMNDKRIDLLRIYQENLVGIERNESLSFFEDMNYIGNSAVSINNINSSIDSILSFTKKGKLSDV